MLVNAPGAVDVDIIIEEGPDVGSLMQDTYEMLRGYPPGYRAASPASRGGCWRPFGHRGSSFAAPQRPNAWSPSCYAGRAGVLIVIAREQ
jgi:hypothetical protein